MLVSATDKDGYGWTRQREEKMRYCKRVYIWFNAKKSKDFQELLDILSKNFNFRQSLDYTD